MYVRFFYFFSYCSVGKLFGLVVCFFRWLCVRTIWQWAPWLAWAVVASWWREWERERPQINMRMSKKYSKSFGWSFFLRFVRKSSEQTKNNDIFVCCSFHWNRIQCTRIKKKEQLHGFVNKVELHREWMSWREEEETEREEKCHKPHTKNSTLSFKVSASWHYKSNFCLMSFFMQLSLPFP